MEWVVYEILNTVNGKIYIGSTNNIDRRMRSHRHPSSKCTVIKRAIYKYGWDAFRVEIVGRYKSSDEALEAETREISSRGSLIPKGYNVLAKAGSVYGYKHTLENRLRQSMRQKGVKQSSDLVARRIAHQFGKSLTPSHRKSISESCKGKAKSPETLKKIKEARSGVSTRDIMVSINGVVYNSMKEASLSLGLSKSAVSFRFRNKFLGHEIIGTNKERNRLGINK